MKNAPASIWLVQGILSFSCLCIISITLITVNFILQNPQENQASVQEVIYTHLPLFMRILMLCVFPLCFLSYSLVSIAQRHRQARGLGIVALLLVLALTLYFKFTISFPIIALHSSSTYSAAWIDNSLLLIGFCTIFYYFAWGEKALAFFAAVPDVKGSVLNEEGSIGMQ